MTRVSAPVPGVISASLLPRLIGELEGETLHVDDALEYVGGLQVERRLRIVRPGLLLGAWERRPTGRVPARGCDYAAIWLMHEDLVVFVASRETARVARSLLFPGLGDLERRGSLLTFAPPWELIRLEDECDE
jgi:hypothetical protein